MSILGGYRYSSAASGSTATASIVNVGGFRISGLKDTAGLICCMFKYNYATNKWVPYA